MTMQAQAASGRPPRSWRRVSLLWRVFAANTAIFVVAFAALAWTPVTVHRVATPRELVVLAIGLFLMLAVDLVLLRRTFGPLRRLAAMVGDIDPADPGRRAGALPGAGREVEALARALDVMLDRLERERREQGRRVLAAQERERARIARDLHDEVGQMLTAIALRAERERGHGAGQALDEIAQSALQTLEEVRRIGRELRPEALDDLGLVSALLALCARVESERRVAVRHEFDWRLPPLPPETELVIYRAAQEALTNVLRHAEATEAVVSLARHDGRVVLAVRDDGRGLAGEPSDQGLRGMRERARLIEAELTVRAAPSGGTEIVLSVPVG